jgi:hypothetical protein
MRSPLSGTQPGNYDVGIQHDLGSDLGHNIGIIYDTTL